MFKTIKRALLVILGVVLFVSGVLIGSGQWVITEDAVMAWSESVSDFMDPMQTKEYLLGFMPRALENADEQIREIVRLLVEKILS